VKKTMASSKKSTKQTGSSSRNTKKKTSPTMTQPRSSETMVQYLPNKGGFLTAHIVGEVCNFLHATSLNKFVLHICSSCFPKS
jgi:hypothetical protein